MVKKFFTQIHKELNGVSVFLAFVTALSLAVLVSGGVVNKASAVFQSGHGDAPAAPTDGEKGATQTTPTPSASASASPITSNQPKGNGTGSTLTDPTPEASKSSSFSWTSWLVGGGVALLIAVGGGLWYMQRIRHRSRQSTKR